MVSKSYKKKIGAVIAIVVLVGAIVGGYALYRKKDGKKDGKKDEKKDIHDVIPDFDKMSDADKSAEIHRRLMSLVAVGCPQEHKEATAQCVMSALIPSLGVDDTLKFVAGVITTVPGKDAEIAHTMATCKVHLRC